MDTICRADTVLCTLTGILKVWNLSGLVYSSQSDRVSEERVPDAATDSPQVVTSAFYCEALDAVCVTTHEQNIVFYHRDGLKQFKQVLSCLFYKTGCQCHPMTYPIISRCGRFQALPHCKSYRNLTRLTSIVRL